MKMKKLIITILGIGLLFSCNNITDLNVNPKSASKVPGETLFTSAQKNLTDFLANSNQNRNIWRLIDQYWTETTYVDEANYNLAGRSIPDNEWAVLYRDVLKDLDEATTLLNADQTASAKYSDKDFKNVLGCVEITKVYTWYILVSTFGDIPYTQALDVKNLSPAYDDAATVYNDLLTRLDAALGSMDASGSGMGSADLLYGGDIGLWIKFGNSLKLKMGMQLADVDNAKAKSIVEAAAPNTFSSNADNAMFVYASAPPNTNPIWVDLVQSKRKDNVGADTFVNALIALNDPRLPEFFTTDANGAYSGGPYGTVCSWAQYSKPPDRILQPTMEQFWMDYAEVEFLKAEAVERGFNVGGTAQAHYNNAITASMQYWGVDAASIATYLAQPSVNYATATGNYKQKIGTQEWIAMYNNAWAEWTDWRRLDFPVLTPPAQAVSPVPVRYTYPTTEANLNSKNYDAASAKIGGDKVTVKLFWDKN